MKVVDFCFAQQVGVTTDVVCAFHLLDMTHEARFLRLCLLDIFRRLIQHIKLLEWSAGKVDRPVKPIEHTANDVKFILDNLYGFFYSFKIGTVNITIATILMQSLVHLSFDTKIIHNKPFFFAGIYTVHSRYGLNKSVHLEWLEAIHCVETRNIEAGYPHIHNYSYLEIALNFLELLVKSLAILIVAEMII